MNNFAKKIIACLSAAAVCASACGVAACSDNGGNDNLLASYSFEDVQGSETLNSATGNYDKINYVFNSENADNLLKEPSDPLVKKGVSGTALYMDGFSTSIEYTGFKTPDTAITLSAWVAPRVFENLPDYDAQSIAAGQPRMTSVINEGNIEMGYGFLLGYGRLGLWGLQLALYSYDRAETFVMGFYDPINALPLYEWSHITAVYDGDSGYVALFYNGEKAYEDIIPELVNTEIVDSVGGSLLVGAYSEPVIEYSISRQLVSGLLDEVRVYGSAFTPERVHSMYEGFTQYGQHPALDYAEIALDSSVYEGDRYRPQYHAIPPAVWMNEPHSPFYYKGRYHVFYQCNPSGPYWAQIRWGHIVSDDMVHWEYVKDAVVPTAGICPEGVWTGGACIGPDGTPWLAITAGTNKYGNPNHGGQNVAFAHAANPDDPDLTDWIVEDTLTITQTGDEMGEREQFRDPFVWYDDETEQYFMLVSSSVPGAGGTANVFTSVDMHQWEHHGFLYECPYPEYSVAGEHWECVVMLPISNESGTTKYILFDCPQYARGEEEAAPAVECYYWIGEFDKENCRFIPDNHEPKLFDMGTATFTGQNGFCYLTDEQKEAGATYEDGRTVIYAIAQGKDAGTGINYYAGWAHNFALPLELSLSEDDTEVIRRPIGELDSLCGEVEYDYSGDGLTAEQINSAIADVRGDTIKIEAEFTLAPTTDNYCAKIGVRYNLNETNEGTERTFIEFKNGEMNVDRFDSTLLPDVTTTSDHNWEYGDERKFKVTVYLDRSMLEIYVNGTVSATMRIYPMYGDSDYIRLVDENAGMTVTKFKITQMKSAYSADGSVTPPYYGNTGNLGNN